MNPISSACFDQDVWIRIAGRGSFKCSGVLKELVQCWVQKNYHHFVLDLMHCEQMDSTFMGTITGIAQRLRQRHQGTLRVINVSLSNQELMENLGLDNLFTILPLSQGVQVPPNNEAASFSEPKRLHYCTDDKAATEQIVISAHEALVEADEKNAAKFKDFFEAVR